MKYLHGQFKSNNDTLYEVRIKNNDAASGEIVIGGDTVKFSSDPVHIDTNCESLFTHIIKKSCTINLYSKIYLGDYLFATNQNDVEVEVYEGNNLIFKGYVEPNIFSMPYAHEWEQISINCLDYLCMTQYSKPTDNSTYEAAKANATIKPLYQIIGSIIPYQIVFDGSRKKVGSTNNIFHDISVNELIFLGENEDDVMTNEEILFEILQYLNLHIIQEGNVFYIFDFNSRHKNSITWVDMWDNTLYTNQTVNTISLDKNDYASDGTSITIDDVFNQIQVKAIIEKMETVVESPLDKNKLYSQFGNYQKFMTEFYRELESGNIGQKKIEAAVDMKQLVKGETAFVNAKLSWQRDHFFQIKENPNWTFYHNGNDIYEELYEDDSNNVKVKQWKFLKYLRENRFASCIMSLAKGEKIHPQDIDDTQLSFNDCLVISVNGEGKADSEAVSEFANDIQAQSPIIEYNGNSNGVYSPNDEQTTNYLVFSGKLTLVPIVRQSGHIYGEYASSQNNKYSDTITMLNLDSDQAPSTDFIAHSNVIYGGEYGSYYLNKYWTQEKSIKDTPYIANPYYNYYQPMTDVGKIQDETIKYNLSVIDGQSYSIDKVPILECELKIGDKFCVETFVQGSGGDFKESSFGWYTLNECPYENGIRKTTFSLGIRPKVGDVIIGKEHNLQTNFDYTWNIAASDGTAIPITRSDNLQGKVEFRIVGLINSTWNNQLTRKTTFWDFIFRVGDKSILNYISSVIIKDFECKIYSDNNGYNNNSDNDLIYLSDEQHEYIKVKDDIEMKINTALSSEEAYNYKVENTVNLSNVVDTNSGYALSEFQDTVENETAKGEELYCNWYYNEYSIPKIILETDLKDSVNIDLFNKYSISYMNKNFGIVETSRDLKENQTHIKFREI